MAVVTPLNNPGGPEGDTVTMAEQLLNTEYWVAGAAAAGLRRMPCGRWGPAIGGRPHRHPPRRRVSPAPFFLADDDPFIVLTETKF